MHKNTPEQLNSKTTAATDRTGAVNRDSSNIQNLPVLDIEKENRLSKVISLNSKGLTQAEIAQELGVLLPFLFYMENSHQNFQFCP
jgi:hypothetical protein